ncbi:hypothetical protein EDEG_00321 [Edhazardia aedis USNM 41457]|uniref:Large ribosomal subunit protein uL6 alpha-beta domain-containing protein n=1 Tax=Edhazardia aedis (strain USNM 41457) TaxID=1003232 RepID=J9DH95_EDHAE|nr:hypothetical protein EDEG_00321 [Edhazardia aedis USNM 41457]|eukprot:EJW01975.1 hypothetical protein EDEG_00321 [Edhazardia aedis USNM 41457]
MRLLLKEETVPIPENCQVSIQNKIIKIKSPKYSRRLDLKHLNLTIEKREEHVAIKLWNGVRKERAKVTTCASIIRNALNGCDKGFVYTLKAASVHFPIGVEIEDEGKTVVIKNFLGEQNIRKYRMTGQCFAKLGEEKNTIVLQGSSIEDVSQSAASLITNCRVKRFDTRKFLDGIYITKKGFASDDY